MQSHPSWVRGLKLDTRDGAVLKRWSHPSWVRGLKRERIQTRLGSRLPVAPLVGAWIETPYLQKWFAVLMSHPSWVRGLKHI